MTINTSEDVFLQLVRLGIGTSTEALMPEHIDWDETEALAKRHGLLSVLVDGVEKLPDNFRPPKLNLLRWIGEAQLEEARYYQQWCKACKMAQLFHQNPTY